MQDKILSVNPNIPNNIKQYLNWYFQLILDKVLLIAYLYENENFSFVSNKEFLGETVRRLSMLDGKEDLFLVWEKFIILKIIENLWFQII